MNEKLYEKAIEKVEKLIIEEEIEELEEEAAKASTAGSIAADIKLFEERVWQLYRDNLKQKQELYMKDLFKKRLYCGSNEPTEDRWESETTKVTETHISLFHDAHNAAKAYLEGWDDEEEQLLHCIKNEKLKLEKIKNENQSI